MLHHRLLSHGPLLILRQLTRHVSRLRNSVEIAPQGRSQGLEHQLNWGMANSTETGGSERVLKGVYLGSRGV
eukprot:7588132-Pyramimonas_sp.AAC.2